MNVSLFIVQSVEIILKLQIRVQKCVYWTVYKREFIFFFESNTNDS